MKKSITSIVLSLLCAAPPVFAQTPSKAKPAAEGEKRATTVSGEKKPGDAQTRKSLEIRIAELSTLIRKEQAAPKPDAEKISSLERERRGVQADLDRLGKTPVAERAPAASAPKMIRSLPSMERSAGSKSEPSDGGTLGGSSSRGPAGSKGVDDGGTLGGSTSREKPIK